MLLSGSAVGYYGSRGDTELTEQAPPGDDFAAEVCVAWEGATAPAADAGIRVVTFRTGIVLAAHGGALQRMLLPFKLGLGGRIGSGDQYMSWIALDDHVGALRHLLGAQSVSGPVNLTAPNPVTNAEFTPRPGWRTAPPDGAAHPAVPAQGDLRRGLVQPRSRRQRVAAREARGRRVRVHYPESKARCAACSRARGPPSRPGEALPRRVRACAVWRTS